MMHPVATAWVLLDAKMLGRPPISSHLPLLRFLLHSDMAVQEGRKICQPKIGRHNSSGANNFGNRCPSWKLSPILLKVTCSKTQEMPTSLYKTCLKPWHYPSKQGHYWPQSCPNLPELYTAGEFWSPPEFSRVFRFSCGQDGSFGNVHWALGGSSQDS